MDSISSFVHLFFSTSRCFPPDKDVVSKSNRESRRTNASSHRVISKFIASISNKSSSSSFVFFVVGDVVIAREETQSSSSIPLTRLQRDTQTNGLLEFRVLWCSRKEGGGVGRRRSSHPLRATDGRFGRRRKRPLRDDEEEEPERWKNIVVSRPIDRHLEYNFVIIIIIIIIGPKNISIHHRIHHNHAV